MSPKELKMNSKFIKEQIMSTTEIETIVVTPDIQKKMDKIADLLLAK